MARVVQAGHLWWEGGGRRAHPASVCVQADMPVRGARPIKVMGTSLLFQLNASVQAALASLLAGE